MEEEKKSSKPKNAFNLLMSSAKKAKIQNKNNVKSKSTSPNNTKRRKIVSSTSENITNNNSNYNISTSKFVPCPICNVNIVESGINVHIDKCMERIKNESIAEQKRSTDSNNDVRSEKLGNSNTEMKLNGSEKQRNDSSSPCKTDIDDQHNAETFRKRTELDPDSNKQKEYSKSNVFHHLINQSKRLYQTKKPNTYRFHLHDEEGKLSWTCCSINSDNDTSNDTINSHEFHEHWKASVLIKREGSGQEKDELIISSSVPCFIDENKSNEHFTANPIEIKKLAPLVLNHSKFSVHVLKSCLQKAIRRKRPLPAVRCAMELMDKSYVDFIRRIPIIILEDSFLHPDYPLLVWLMIAASKDYIPPLSIVAKIMRIVFEVASCSWIDDLDVSTQKDDFELDLRLDCNVFNSLSDEESMILRSMMLRKHYGGMKCDMSMLNLCITQWYRRFKDNKIDKDITKRCFNHSTQVSWNEVPYMLHREARRKSERYVPPLILGQNPVIALTLNDITASGVDFHCTNVLDYLLQDERCHTHISQAWKSDHKNNCTVDGSTSNETLMTMLKGWMWTYSSGVNFRRSFAGYDKPPLSSMYFYQQWTTIVEPQMKLFVNNYIKCRINSINNGR